LFQYCRKEVDKTTKVFSCFGISVKCDWVGRAEGENQFSDSNIRSEEKREGALAAAAKGLVLEIF